MRWKDFITTLVTRHWNNWFKKVERTLTLFTSPYVPQENHYFSPVKTLLAVITSIILLAVAIGSFCSVVISLIVIYFILTRFFGIDFDDVYVVSA